jgi:PTH1 family peptidyl-tRNA hydrolase
MKIIVGLGNPGSQYAGTRHNIGFEVIDYLAAAPGVTPFRTLFQGKLAEAMDGLEKVLLIKPETYMNLSGRCVRAALDFYKLTVEDLLIVCDDFNLPLGKLRIRGDGSHGGQNGLRNIQEQLGTPQYARLRLGVGQPGPGDAVDFVLSRFKTGEQAAVTTMIADAAQAALHWVRLGVAGAGNLVNGPPPQAKKPPRLREQKQPAGAHAPANKTGSVAGPPLTPNPSPPKQGEGS